MASPSLRRGWSRGFGEVGYGGKDSSCFAAGPARSSDTAIPVKRNFEWYGNTREVLGFFPISDVKIELYLKATQPVLEDLVAARGTK